MTSEKFLVLWQNRQGQWIVTEKDIARQAVNLLCDLSKADLWAVVVEYNSGMVIARS